MRRRAILLAVLVVMLAILAWLVVARGPRPVVDTGGTAGAPEAPPAAGRKITATLYYVSEDGMALVGAQREVPLGEPISEQARFIVEAQLGAAPAPFASAIPDGTTLRAVYVGARGDAFVDLSTDAAAKHRGGSLDELFTVYAIVNALTVNLPAVTDVQILVNGKEVDTLAGHVDLRHPLQKSLKWVRTEKDAS
jgi:spore germination protein GerM